MIPFFSIGVTTYNRNDLLKECLHSILQQNFGDYEIIVGNDYTHQELTADTIGVYDPRIKIVNYPKNLGPIGNANALLSMSNGRYFTLLADDDMHTVHYLQVMYDSLIKYNFPPCIFCSFTSNIDVLNKINNEDASVFSESKLFSGRQFLTEYLSRNLLTIGCYGVFEIGYLKSVGGLSQLGEGRSMYAEMPLVIEAGLLEKVAYLNHPLVFFRAHSGSLCNNSTDVDAYVSSQKALFRKCIDIFKKKEIYEDFQKNIFLLIKWCIQDVVEIMHRSGSIHYRVVLEYAIFLKQLIDNIKYSLYYWKSIEIIIRIPTIKLFSALVWKCWKSFSRHSSLS